MIADTAEGLAQATIKLLRDKALQRQLGAAGQKVVRQGYSWDRIAAVLDAVYNEFRK
jgi:glycosyltransferase involved in cell wall biosynthesis